MNDPIVGHIQFTDACERDIYQACDGRQYVVDDYGQPIAGVWMIEPDDEADSSFIVQVARALTHASEPAHNPETAKRHGSELSRNLSKVSEVRITWDIVSKNTV
jgi:hypothetical protein